MSIQESILTIENLKVHFPLKKSWIWQQTRFVKAVDGVSFAVKKGETLGIVGESGCGKSTLIRAVVGLVHATEGKVVWAGRDLTALKHKKSWQPVRKEIQMIFQDPFASLNPRITIGNIIAEPLRVHEPHLSKEERRSRVEEMMRRVGLSPMHINRYPHQFSGGQCQRVGIARALILKPSILVCDEPVSALDVSIQAQVVNLLKELQQSLGLTILFIAHNLSVIKHITKALLSAVPLPDPELERNKQIQILEGDLPSPINPPSGCVFRTRCPLADEMCAREKPPLHQLSQERKVACIKVY